VSLTERDRVLSFTVADDGRGFDPAAAAASTGLQNMKDRIGALGGTLTITSTPESGTSVTGNIPLRP
jgi:signal transduction histidine kinase